jgi:N-glycosylase/DNA lyase
LSIQIPKEVTFTVKSDFSEFIFDKYYELESKVIRKPWFDYSESELWVELCFCILSSNVSYENALSATRYLSENNFLNLNWILNHENAQQLISNELSRDNFLPKKKDDSLRKYRFPNVRSKNIVSAAHFLYEKNNGVKKLLKKFLTEFVARDFFHSNVTGLGLKEASHFLRNIGYSNSLAIIDVHIASFLHELNLLESSFPINTQRYLEMETKMISLAKFFDCDLSLLDNVVWNYMRLKSK